jgi:hypothetical protein
MQVVAAACFRWRLRSIRDRRRMPACPFFPTHLTPLICTLCFGWVQASNVMAIPAGFSYTEAAAVPETFLTGSVLSSLHCSACLPPAHLKLDLRSRFLQHSKFCLLLEGKRFGGLELVRRHGFALILAVCCLHCSVQKGENVLIHAGASGVGTAAIQLVSSTSHHICYFLV